MTSYDRWHLDQAWTYLRHVNTLDATEAAKLRAFVDRAEAAEPLPDPTTPPKDASGGPATA